MKRWKKSFMGGLTLVLLGFSCCWLSAFVIGLSSAGVVGWVSYYLGSFKIVFIALGALFIFVSLKSFLKKY